MPTHIRMNTYTHANTHTWTCDMCMYAYLYMYMCTYRCKYIGMHTYICMLSRSRKNYSLAFSLCIWYYATHWTLCTVHKALHAIHKTLCTMCHALYAARFTLHAVRCMPYAGHYIRCDTQRFRDISSGGSAALERPAARVHLGCLWVAPEGMLSTVHCKRMQRI